MTHIGTTEHRFKLLGGALCLDFTNTVAWYSSDNPRDRFATYADLIAWGRQTGTLTEPEAQHLLEIAAQRSDAAADTVERARALRRTIHRIFSALAGGGAPDQTDLDVLNILMAEAFANLRIVKTEHDFRWAWGGAPERLDRVLWPVVQSAAALLTSEELDRVKECPGKDCGWLFVDRSRNRSRRWCDMADCGNRAKVRRYRASRRTRADEGIEGIL